MNAHSTVRQSFARYALLAGVVAAGFGAVPTPSVASHVERRASVFADLYLHGGSHAGRHALQSDVIECRTTRDPKGSRNDFSVDFGFFPADPRINDARSLNHVRLDVPNVDADSRFLRFYLEVTFGNPRDVRTRTTHVVNTRSADGELFGGGTLRMQRTDSGARLLIDARTREGIRLTGSLNCRSIREI